MFSNHEQIPSLYRLRALPNGKYCVLEYKDPDNFVKPTMSLDMTGLPRRAPFSCLLVRPMGS
jgi:hypothetical protein